MTNAQLREARRKKRLTQVDLGFISGIFPQDISAYECGRKHIWPSHKRRLAVALGLDPSEFDREEGQ